MAKQVTSHILLDELAGNSWGHQWFWPKRIPHKKVTIESGNWGSGKSRSFASVLTSWFHNEPFPDGSYSDIDPGVVVLVTTESEDDELIEMFKLHGCDDEDLRNIRLFTGISDPDKGTYESFDIDLHLAQFEDFLAEHKPSLVVFDPLVEFHHRKEVDSHAIRGLMSLLNALCLKYEFTMVCFLHWNKNEKLSSSNRLAGSHQYAASVKSLITVLKDRKDQTLHHFLQEKHNLSGPPIPLSFRFDDSGIVMWESGVVLSEVTTKIEQAQTWLVANLEDPHTVQWCVENSGITEATLRRARSKLGQRIQTVYITKPEYEGHSIPHWQLLSEKNNWGLASLSIASPGS